MPIKRKLKSFIIYRLILVLEQTKGVQEVFGLSRKESWQSVGILLALRSFL